ncbi:MAG: magnesium/cobalt transporter CorA [Candidatus Omnitrophica bacterium]|nr:magnesium/cobalt transporter CorA [Candidatus Omnitrophota bacterium]
MPKLYKKVSKKIGLPPGTLIHVGEKRTKKTIITAFDYDETFLDEPNVKSIKDCFAYRDKPSRTWINIDGVEQVEIIEQIDAHFGIHPLVQEDIVNTEQRAKMEDYGAYLYIVVKMLYYDSRHHGLKAEQVSLLIGHNYVITFQEHRGDVFETIRDRLRANKGRIRKMGTDYLAYALLDAIVDHYYLVLERYGNLIEDMEEELITDVSREMNQEIHLLKRDVIYLRRQICPIKDVIHGLLHTDSMLIKESTGVFLKDVFDHAVQVIDTIESFGEVITGLNDIYLSNINNKTNESMKVLVFFVAVFMPATFFTCLFGMNFNHMPMSHWRLGFYVMLGALLLVLTGILVYFKKKKWL